MIVLDRIQATQDLVGSGRYLVTIFWHDPENSNDYQGRRVSRNHSVNLSELLSLPGRMSKVGFTPLGDVVQRHDAR
jgi:hypothetical protein